MKYCEEYAALLDLFVDGELAAEDMERVGRHLAECPGCRAYVDDALAIRAGFPDAEDTPVPEGFAGGVMERIERASARERKTVELKRRGLRRWTAAGAALAACCALVVLVRSGPGDMAAAPGGENGAAVSDMSAATGSGAAGSGEEEIAPQMAEPAAAAQEAADEAPEAKEAPEEAPAAAEARLAPMLRTAEADNGDEPPEEPGLGAAMTALDGGTHENAAKREAALCLTAEEAGNLLDGFAVVWENAVEWRYELNAEEYRALLEALGRPEEMPEEAEGPFLVSVTGPKE